MQANRAPASTAGAYGTFTLGTNGVWTYTAANANPAIQALGAGQTLTETSAFDRWHLIGRRHYQRHQ